MSKTKTCGALLATPLRTYARDQVDLARVFYAGFVFGQAEKVHIGSCRACMVSTACDELEEVVRHIVYDAAGLYGLQVSTLGDEYWLSRPGAIEWAIDRLLVVPKNCDEWHQIRASLCGVPLDEVDVKFHERTGACRSNSVCS